LCSDLNAISDLPALRSYLSAQVKARADDYLEAGRAAGLSFDEIYRNLRRIGNDRGLSNSEAVLAAGLWGAKSEGAQIAHVGLAQYFPASGAERGREELRETILASDAIVLSGPVYFGDRGSLAQEFIEFLRADKQCAEHLRGRVYGGIAVGAKRNGGQETTLIYQLVDMTNLNMLAVGNDAATTSQYGGTAVAGDVGTVAKDDEGIATSVGTGRRVARIAKTLANGRSSAPKKRVRIALWLLQDSESRGRQLLEQFVRDMRDDGAAADFEISDFSEEEILRCIACDICPTDVGARDEYRCIISNERDLFAKRHRELLGADGVLLCAYSPVSRKHTKSRYQRFIERTRYLRRDDYVFANALTAPFVISEVDSNQNLHIRMLTSFLRQLTVLHHPIIGVEWEGRVLNWATVLRLGKSFVDNAITLATGLALDTEATPAPENAYQPVGYKISSTKVAGDREIGRTRRALEESKEQA
jgi:multimeric flavodoxin WrbA